MSAPEPRRLTIDLWSDVMCPWCLIGYGQLRKGLELLEGEIEADIRWHAFELNFDMPPEGEEQEAHLQRKYGRSLEEGQGIRAQMRRTAESAGVSLDYQGDPEDSPPAMMWNTFLAHKLLGRALEIYGPEIQTALKLALFEAHFNRRENVSDPQVLLTIAEAQGLDREAAAVALEDEALSARVRAEERAAFDMNITGVPAMLVERKFMIPGAQDAQVYADALRRVAEKTSA